MIKQNIINYVNWLGIKNQTIALNIANADTPLYKTQDLEPFNMQAPHQIKHTTHGEEFISGNNVNLQDELYKLSDVNIKHNLMISAYKEYNKIIKNVIKR